MGADVDERLEAGRHHLSNGERALREGYLDDGRSHFEAALLQFRGPELRIGEAHAMRGLAAIELGTGNLHAAEEAVRGAIGQYVDVVNMLRVLDTEGVSAELRRDAEEGEGSALVLQAEIMLRSGRADDAEHSLIAAREIFDVFGDIPSAASVYAMLGRVHLRRGKPKEAGVAFGRAASIHASSGDIAGRCTATLSLAEAARLAGQFEEAEHMVTSAQEFAHKSGDPSLQGRAFSAAGALYAQQDRLEEARDAYAAALPKIRKAGDVLAEAYALLGLGDLRSRTGDGGGLSDLMAGTQLLANLEHRHGMGAGMLRMAQHALRFAMPGYGLAAAEASRQLWMPVDPVRGVGQALRWEVKALAQLKRWPVVVSGAYLRAEVAGYEQPNALEVRAFYKERAPTELITALDELTMEELEARFEEQLEGVLGPVLRQLDLDFQSLGMVGGALAVVEAMLRATPAPAAPQRVLSPRVVGEEAPTNEVEELPDSAIEELPPEEEIPATMEDPYDGLYSPPEVPFDGVFAEDEEETEDFADPDDPPLPGLTE